LPEPEIPDDRELLKASEASLLIIGTDKLFAEIVKGIVLKNGYKFLAAKDGKEGMKLAEHYQPKGILLDEQLPDMKGLRVLDHLKFSLKTRHIPVFLMATVDQKREALSRGAKGFSLKPVSFKQLENSIQKVEKIHGTPTKELLLVEPEETNLKNIKSLLKNKELTISTAATAEEALEQLKANNYDCVILGADLPDNSGLEIMKKMGSIEGADQMPVIIYPEKKLSRSQGKELHSFNDSIVVKGAASIEQLLDEVTLFLHTDEGKLSARQRKVLAELHDPKLSLKGRKVLLVDDDERNSYALSQSLADMGMKIRVAENGKKAIEKLEQENEIDIVLMDVMMPVMDGYEATTE